MWSLILTLNYLFVGSLALGGNKSCGGDGEGRKVQKLYSSMIDLAEKKYLESVDSCAKELANRRAYVQQNQFNLSICRTLLMTANAEDLQNSESNVGRRYTEKECKTLLKFSDSLITLNNDCSFLRDADYVKKTPAPANQKAKYNSGKIYSAQSLNEKRGFVNEKCGKILAKSIQVSTVGPVDANAKMRLTKAKIEGLINSEEGFSKFRSQLDSAGGNDSQIEKVCLQYAADDVI